jgi:hypothetical protein
MYQWQLTSLPIWIGCDVIFYYLGKWPKVAKKCQNSQKRPSCPNRLANFWSPLKKGEKQNHFMYTKCPIIVQASIQTHVKTVKKPSCLGSMLWSQLSTIFPIFGEKIGVFLRYQCYDKIILKFGFVLSQNAENILIIITSVPGLGSACGVVGREIESCQTIEVASKRRKKYRG